MIDVYVFVWINYVCLYIYIYIYKIMTSSHESYLLFHVFILHLNGLDISFSCFFNPSLHSKKKKEKRSIKIKTTKAHFHLGWLKNFLHLFLSKNDIQVRSEVYIHGNDFQVYLHFVKPTNKLNTDTMLKKKKR